MRTLRWLWIARSERFDSAYLEHERLFPTVLNPCLIAKEASDGDA